MQQYTTAPYVRVFFNKSVLSVGAASIQKNITDPQQQDIILGLLSFFLMPSSLERATIHMASNDNKDAIQPILDMMVEAKWVIPASTYVRNSRYSRPALYYELSGADAAVVQDKLSKKHVAILGCGGIGSVVAVNLVTAGIGEVSLVDDDMIEESNLTRQFLFANSDIGRPKVEILKERLQERAQHTKINTYNFLIKDELSSQLIPHSDLMVVSGDSSNIVQHVNKYAFKQFVPFICAGYIEDIAVVGPLVVPGKGRCTECFDKTYAKDNILPDKKLGHLVANINKNYQAPSNGPLNMLAASLASLDIIKFLGGFGQPHSLGKRVGLWTHDFHIQTQEYCYDGVCAVCNP